jgi:hypothetical protein
MSQVRVTYESEVLGNGTFWQGDEKEIAAIRNIPARICAEAVVKERTPKKIGMWRVEIIDAHEGQPQ